MPKRVLVVEDEADLLASLEYNLGREGWSPIGAPSGADALAVLRTDPLPDLVLLDLMLPDMSGKEICRRLKAEPRTRRIPVIMVTARAEELDRIVGLELGADDYVTKPYSVRELMLRVAAVLRRAGPEPLAPPVAAAAPTPQGTRVRIDEAAHRVWVDGEAVELTALEFRLLRMFVARTGRVQTRDSLLEEVWGVSSESNTRTVDTHVKRLRQKLGEAGSCVETVRGVGYRFSDGA